MSAHRIFTLAVAGLLLGGCAETWDNFVTAVKPPDDRSRPVVENEILALAGFETAAGSPAERHPAAQHIEKLADEVMAVLSDGSMPEDQRIAYFRDRLARDLDIPLIARFVAGRFWRTANDDQRREYLEVFTAYVVETYSARLGGAEVDGFQVLDTLPVGKRDILVRCRVTRAHASPINADWRLTRRNGTFRILDLSVEGISMALTLRQEFSSVLRRKGGVDSLIAILRERTT